jgi:hypothetical protein
LGACAFCGESAGFLRSEHPECRSRHDEKIAEQGRLLADLERQATEAVVSGSPDALAAVAERSNKPEIADAGPRAALVRAYGAAIDRLLEGEGVDANSEKGLVAYASWLGLTDDEKKQDGAQTKIVKALILRDVAAGVIKSRMEVSGTVPFVFKKDEVILWFFNDVRLLEVRQFTHYEGRSQGVSLRVAKGVYYRMGAFKGAPVKNEKTVEVDSGVVALTQHAVYFGGRKKTVRIPYAKLVSVEPFSDGIGLQKDGASARPVTLTPIDGWFTYNLVKTLAANVT